MDSNPWVQLILDAPSVSEGWKTIFGRLAELWPKALGSCGPHIKAKRQRQRMRLRSGARNHPQAVGPSLYWMPSPCGNCPFCWVGPRTVASNR